MPGCRDWAQPNPAEVMPARVHLPFTLITRGPPESPYQSKHNSLIVRHEINWNTSFHTTQASLRPSSYPAHIISGNILRSMPRVLCHISHSSLSIIGTSTFCNNLVPYLLPLIKNKEQNNMKFKELSLQSSK